MSQRSATWSLHSDDARRMAEVLDAFLEATGTDGITALPGAVVQITVATLLGWGVSRMLGWSHVAGFVFGLSLSVASADSTTMRTTSTVATAAASPTSPRPNPAGEA